jgi:hypothetical protein
MKKALLLITCIITFSSFAKEAEKISDFHRLLAFNDKQQLMVVKIKNTDFWVTPGLYNKYGELAIKELHQQAAEYGLTITPPELRGVFTLNIKNTNKQSIRYFYRATVKKGEVKLPETIEQIKWLSIDEAMQLITFPHIKILIKQIMNHPDGIWAGSIMRYQEDGKLKAKMTEDFFSFQRH